MGCEDAAVDNSLAAVHAPRAQCPRLLPLRQGGVQKSAGSAPCSPWPDISPAVSQAPFTFSLCSSLSVSFDSSKHFHLYGSNASLAQVWLCLFRSLGNRGQQRLWGTPGQS